MATREYTRTVGVKKFSIASAFVSVPSGVLSSAVAIAFVPLESLLSSSSSSAAAFSVVGGGAYFSGDRAAVSADFTVSTTGSIEGKRAQTQEYLKGFRAGILLQ